MKVDPKAFKGLSRFLAPSAGGPVADRALGEKLISSEQLQSCVEEQDRSGRPLDEILVERGHLKEEDVTRLRDPAVPAAVHPFLGNPERVLGHYVLVSLLGVGGMAEVWKAWDTSLGRWVALKYLKQDIGHPTQRIEREGRMAGQVSHPSIISIFARGQHGGRPYLVMPFVDGTPPKAPLPPREAARMLHEVACGLIQVHDAGVIHRDIKPANILVEAGGRTVLADFGLAIQDDSPTSRWAMSGTPEYASPEQIRGDPLDVRTDVYSLGATLHHLLSGRPPFSGTNADEITEKVLKQELPPLPDAPKALQQIVRRAMARDRAQRYPSMTEVAAALKAYLDRSVSGIRLKPAWVAVAILSALLPWGATLLILSEFQKLDDRRQILQALREGDRKLSVAERLRADSGAMPLEVSLAAREGLREFDNALRLSGGVEPEAQFGIGRCWELLGENVRAEQAYLDAGPLPGAQASIVRLWTRAVLEGRRERDFRALILKRAASSSLARLYVEGNYAEVLNASPRDGDDEMGALLQGAAALELKNWTEALRRIEAGLRRRPQDSTLLYYKGLALAELREKSKALEAWNEALKFEPRDWALHAEVLRRQKDLQR